MHTQPFINSTIVYIAALALASMPLAAQTSDPHLARFKDVNGRYTFSYPNYFKLDHEFADGSGEVVGIRAEPGGYQEASIAVRVVKSNLSSPSTTAFVDQVKGDFAKDPRIKFVSAATRTFLGKEAGDLNFDQGPMRVRIIGLVSGHEDIVVRCVYTRSVAQMFAPACEMVADTLKLLR